MPKQQKQIIQTLYKNTEQNNIDIEKLKKIEIVNKPVIFNKKIQKIILINNQLLPDSYLVNDGISLNQEFENLPEWLIPNIYVFYYFSTLNGYIIENSSFSGFIYHLWKQNSENNWIFQFACTNVSRINGQPLPIYFTLILYFNNPKNYYEI